MTLDLSLWNEENVQESQICLSGRDSTRKDARPDRALSGLSPSCAGENKWSFFEHILNKAIRKSPLQTKQERKPMHDLEEPSRTDISTWVSAFQNEISNAKINTVLREKTRSWGCLALLGQLRVSYYMLQHDVGVLCPFVLTANRACVLVGRYAANRLQRSPSLTKAAQSSSSGFLCAATMERLESEKRLERACRFQEQAFILMHTVTGCTRILFCFSLWKVRSVC